MLDKTKIKKEITDICNKVLDKYNESYRVDDVSIMNSSTKIIFLGHLRVYNEENTQKLFNELEDSLKDIGDLDITNRRVVPCCSLPYNQISYHISFNR